MKKVSRKIDCLGILHLHRVPNIIKKFTTQINNLYLSRNSFYYKSKPLYEISQMREELLSHLCNDKVTNYIIFDYVINFSAQTYYYLMSLKAETKLIKQSQNCLQEDVNNMVSLLENKNQYSNKHILPKTDLFIEFRNIELDNKLEIYAYIKSFGKSNLTFITPGLGSILIGPFFKAIWGNNYKNLLFSRFKNKSKNTVDFKTTKNMRGNLYLIDDNIGSGFTTQEIKQLFENNLFGISAVEYDWYLYDIISKGFSPYTKFNYQLYNKLSLINTRNHKFLDNTIEILIKDPNKYCAYLWQNNFNHTFCSDLKTLFKIGKNVAKRYLPKQIYLESLNFTKNIIKVYKGV